MVVYQHVAERSYAQASAVEFLHSAFSMGHRQRLEACRQGIGNTPASQFW